MMRFDTLLDAAAHLYAYGYRCEGEDMDFASGVYPFYRHGTLRLIQQQKNGRFAIL